MRPETVAVWIGILLCVSTLALKWRFRVDPTKPKTATVPDYDFGDLTKTDNKTGWDRALKAYDISYQDVCYYDKLFWQIPIWVASIGALILAAGNRPEAMLNVYQMAPWAMILFGVFAIVSGYFLYRLLGHRVTSMVNYREIACIVGVRNVRVTLAESKWWWFASASVLYLTFIDWLGVIAITYGVWLAAGCSQPTLP